MLDHVSVGVSDLERSARFYERTLAPLGLSRLVTRPATVGFGKSYPEFWINLRAGLARIAPGSGTPYLPSCQIDRSGRRVPCRRARCRRGFRWRARAAPA